MSENKIHPSTDDSVTKVYTFLKEVQEESDRGTAIFAATFFDEKLKQILIRRFKKGKSTTDLLEQSNGGLHTFSSRINLCFSLGLISNYEYDELNLIKKIRNTFAHNFEYKFSFSDRKVRDICVQLKASTPGDKSSFTDKPRFLFINAVIILHNNLLYREFHTSVNVTDQSI